MFTLRNTLSAAAVVILAAAFVVALERTDAPSPLAVMVGIVLLVALAIDVTLNASRDVPNYLMRGPLLVLTGVLLGTLVPG